MCIIINVYASTEWATTDILLYILNILASADVVMPDILLAFNVQLNA